MPKLTRRTLLAGAMATPLAAPYVARAQTWPSGITRIVVPFPPGGTVDPIARMVQPALQSRLGATVVIENKPGASGSIGASQVAKSAPDGTSWLFVFDTHAVNPALMNLSFDSEKDLDPVLLIGTAPNVLATHRSRPFRGLGDMVDAAKAKPDGITFASVGTGSLGHLSMTVLGKRAGVRWTHVPYRGGGPAMNDAIAGHVDSIIASAALVTPQVKANALRGVVTTGAMRLKSLPDVPTAIESGFPGFESYAWWGVFAPGGTPKPLVDRFAGELIAALREERVTRQLEDSLQIKLVLGGPEELRTFFAEQMRVWGAVVRENGFRADS
ncbi:MAG TPA: tripartite tricarboxylate transporter substrate binding protein [Xanthobacteraceae bacterium]